MLPLEPLERYADDLALAAACAAGDEAAWDRFVRDYRPILYRAADAIDPTGGAREIADALYGELFSRKLFTYYHGKSSLATWLRALLSQRHVDQWRTTRRLDPIDADPPAPAAAGPHGEPDPGRAARAAALETSLAAALAALEPRDRLRLRCYHAQGMTLVQIGRVTGESEATVSRQLARARRTVAGAVRERLRHDHGMSEAEVAECLAAAMDDAGTLDVAALLGDRKNPAVDRSTNEEPS